MVYSGLELFMENLRQLIYSNNNPLVNNHPYVLSERPQFQMLYEELGCMIQALFVNEQHDLQELEKVRDLKKRFKEVAENAQDIIDFFVSIGNLRNEGHLDMYEVFKRSLDLDEVMITIKSIKAKFNMIKDNKTIDSSQRSDLLKTQSAAGTFCIRNRSGNKKVLEEIVVGFNHDVELIRDKLVEDQKRLDVISIVGMGGLGKTTLATKIFNDRYVVYHFHVRAWVTVSQTYEKRDLLIEILESIGVELNLEKASDSRLREMLHKSLMCQRYLIVIDDIWSSKAWDKMKLFFPNHNTGSRILLTTRLKEVALYATSHGFVHHLRYLTKEESWELLRKKVFHGEPCPRWLINPGMKIARNCRGLPLAVIVIAGVLAKEATGNDSWERIAQSVGSYIVNGSMETLALSYNHLPRHLKDCFLYLGGFPEDYKFPVERLMWLWMAEGFVQEAGNRSLEEIAEDYLMELIDRNLLIVTKRKYSGGVKTCILHDLVRELCLEKASEESFCLTIHRPSYTDPNEVITHPKQRCIYTNKDIYIGRDSHPPTPSIRSLLCFYRQTSLNSIHNTAEYFRSFALLRVLHLQNCELKAFPEGIALLVHLRYLAIWYSLGFPSSICNLWSLQTLIIKKRYGPLELPKTISNLVNLRHLWSKRDFYLPSIEKPMNLQTISNVVLGDGAGILLKYFPSIKKLATTLHSHEKNDFELPPYLDTLKLTRPVIRTRKPVLQEFPKAELNFRKNYITFPATLKRLTLVRCRLPWSDMSIIQSLPNLEVLKLLFKAFEGPRWDTGEEPFRRLKFLKLEKLHIRQWEASSINFPRLERLVLELCLFLEEIPLGMGDISTLELIECTLMGRSVVESLDRIREEQHSVGNYELQINVRG